MKKQVCIACFQKFGRKWTSDMDEGWAEGYIECPRDAMILAHHGSPFELSDREVLDKPTANMLAGVFGCRKISEGIPNWCKSKDAHLRPEN